jgi:hypothetical protein
MRNGFAQVDPTTNSNSDKKVVENQFVNLINGPNFTDKSPLDKGSPCRFSPARSPEQATNELKGNDPCVPMNDDSLNVNVKSDVKKLCKGIKQ